MRNLDWLLNFFSNTQNLLSKFRTRTALDVLTCKEKRQASLSIFRAIVKGGKNISLESNVILPPYPHQVTSNESPNSL